MPGLRASRDLLYLDIKPVGLQHEQLRASKRKFAARTELAEYQGEFDASSMMDMYAYLMHCEQTGLVHRLRTYCNVHTSSSLSSLVENHSLRASGISSTDVRSICMYMYIHTHATIAWIYFVYCYCFYTSLSRSAASLLSLIILLFLFFRSVPPLVASTV